MNPYVVQTITSLLYVSTGLMAMTMAIGARLTIRRWAWGLLGVAMGLTGLMQFPALDGIVRSSGILPTNPVGGVTGLALAGCLALGMALTVFAGRKTRRAHIALGESERLFRNLFDTAEVSIWHEDMSDLRRELNSLRARGVQDLRAFLTENESVAWALVRMVRVIDVNRATLLMFGADTKEDFAQSIGKVFGAETLAVFIDELCAIWDGKPNFRAELKLRTLSGDDIHAVLSMPIPQTDEGFRSVPVSLLNVTELHNAYSALRQSEDLFHAIVDNSVNGISLKDADGRFLFCNRTQAAMFGTTPEQVVGKSASHFASGDLLADISAKDRWVIENRQTDMTEVRRLFPDGIARDVLNLKIPIQLSKEGRWGVIIVTTDLTDMRRIEADLRQSQKMEAVGRLTGGVAHDFNNFLMVITGNLQLLERTVRAGENSAERILEYTGPALVAAEKGAALIQHLLAFARKQPLHITAVDVPQLLSGMTDLLRSSLGKSIQIDTRNCTNNWFASADPVQLENAILNLAINARDAMPEEGTLRIETKDVTLSSADADRIENGQAGDYVVLTVSDSGNGMPQEVLERAFEPFYSTKEAGEGSGMGLSTVYGFAQQGGGFVSIWSREGEGTSVELYLPRAISKEDSPPVKPTAIDPVEGQNETILLIEDEPMVRQSMKLLLETMDYDVVEAENGDSAIETFKKNSAIALVLSDVSLTGGISGIEVCKRLRFLRADLKCILISGHLGESLEKELPPDSVLLSKPIDYDELGAAIRRVLDRDTGEIAV